MSISENIIIQPKAFNSGIKETERESTTEGSSLSLCHRLGPRVLLGAVREKWGPIAFAGLLSGKCFPFLFFPSKWEERQQLRLKRSWEDWLFCSIWTFFTCYQRERTFDNVGAAWGRMGRMGIGKQKRKEKKKQKQIYSCPY